MSSKFWQRDVYFVVIIGSGLFVILTIIAMLCYPGGSYTDASTRGYSFFGNFFSELGLARTHAGGEKTISLVLFILAMLLTSVGMMLFFIAFRLRFQRKSLDRLLSLNGTLFGILAGVFFIGVAAFPADVNMPLHTESVMWAFRLFPAAVLCYTVVLFRNRTIPRFAAWELVAFLLMLLGYILLLEHGPGITTQSGMVIQAVGQKIIVYASILTVMIQSWIMLRAPGASIHTPAG